MNKYPTLFSPMTIRGKTYKNRLIAAPTLFAHSVLFLPEIAEKVYRRVENRAKGGFAAVSTGEISVNNEEGTTLFMERTVEFCKLIDGMVDIIHVSNGLKWAGSKTHTFT